MKALVEYVVRSLVAHPDDVQVNSVEGESSVLLELTVAPSDLGAVHGPDGETLRALRTVLSASAGRRKAVLELIEPDAERAPEDEHTEEVGAAATRAAPSEDREA